MFAVYWWSNCSNWSRNRFVIYFIYLFIFSSLIYLLIFILLFNHYWQLFCEDLKIQRTIREQFRNSTVLTIAHRYQIIHKNVPIILLLILNYRINTIMHCDRVLVMDQGQVAEFDSIQNLKENSSSIFYSLLQETVAN